MPPALGNQQLDIYLSQRAPVASLQLILPRTFFAPPCSTCLLTCQGRLPP